MHCEICAFNQRCHFLKHIKKHICGAALLILKYDLGKNKRVPERYWQAVLSHGKDPVKSVDVPGQKSD